MLRAHPHFFFLIYSLRDGSVANFLFTFAAPHHLPRRPRPPLEIRCHCRRRYHLFWDQISTNPTPHTTEQMERSAGREGGWEMGIRSLCALPIKPLPKHPRGDRAFAEDAGTG